jgi:hypothetical protein
VDGHRAVAVARAGGFGISDGFIGPENLIVAGLVTAAEEARARGLVPSTT